MRWVLLVGVVALAGWLALLVTTAGVLVGSAVHPNPGGQAYLLCRYFTGLSVVEQTLWYSPEGTMGRAVCPRLVKL